MAQGWKLHVSATVRSAESVLRRAVPVLLTSTASFKFAASPRRLHQLNARSAEPSAAGKFLTVYPASDDEAVRLAVALDEATRGLENGPVVATDRRLHAESLVSYRYGGFVRQLMQRPAGAIVPALTTPGGDLVEDEREAGFVSPRWSPDPFAAAGVVHEAHAPEALVASRYVSLVVLRRGARGTVEVALDTHTLRAVVLKRARGSAEADDNGQRPVDWLRHEADVLRRLATTGLAPALFDLVDDDGDQVLVMEYIRGETLHERLVALREGCRLIPCQEAVEWGRQLAHQLRLLHTHGLVFRDLKPENVLVTPGGRLRLIDFELAASLGDSVGPVGTGTVGYQSPESALGQPVSVTDDVYSLGALLYGTVTGAVPGLAPRPLEVLRERPLHLLNPWLDGGFARVIERCMAPAESARRFATMGEVEEALERLEVRSIVTRVQAHELEPEEQARADSARMARRLGDAICATAEPTPDGSGLRVPVSRHPRAYGLVARDVNVGTAGIVLALSELATVFDDPKHRETLDQAARWLRFAPALGPRPLAGLYVGEAGISLALLRAGLALGDEALISSATERGCWVASLPHTRLDLFSGTAGRVRFHLMLWDTLGDIRQLDAARQAGEVLLQRVIPADDGTPRWPADDGGDQPCANYAHGAAGIADALLDLYEATGDERCRSVAFGAADWLRRLARPALADGTGLDWPSFEGGPGSAGAWCHGAAGTGIFFLHAAALGLTGAAELAARARRTVGLGTRWSAPTQCHGLAGSIELLLDLYQATGDTTCLSDARELERAMRAFATESNGVVTVHSGWRNLVTPDYMVGYGGVASCLLRLSDPQRRGRTLLRTRAAAHRSVA
jgi:predicted Ser/Thr protein kinase